MYPEELPKTLFTSTLVKIKYDCCEKEHTLKWVAADKNYVKNGGKHICRPCWLKSESNPARSQAVKDKIKKTQFEKFGGYAINTPENVAKRNEIMFGTQEAIDKRNEKTKQTNQERYGADHIMKTEEGQERQRSVIREKYGVDFPLQSEKVKERMKETCQERYGVDNPMKLPENQIKVAESILDKYGVKYYNQLPEMREYMREHCKNWLKESWENPWAKGTTRSEEWNEKQSKTMANKIVAGEFNPEDQRFYITGYFHSDKCKKPNAFFRSGLELLTHWFLHTSEDVKWYENEPFLIKYINEDGNTRRYIPDFFVERVNHIPWLLEIKPAFRMKEEKTKYKIEAAEKYAKENNVEFFYIDEKFLKNLGFKIEEIKNKPNVEVFKK
jgi:hypothetical protein